MSSAQRRSSVSRRSVTRELVITDPWGAEHKTAITFSGTGWAVTSTSEPPTCCENKAAHESDAIIFDVVEVMRVYADECWAVSNHLRRIVDRHRGGAECIGFDLMNGTTRDRYVEECRMLADRFNWAAEMAFSEAENLLIERQQFGRA